MRSESYKTINNYMFYATIHKNFCSGIQLLSEIFFSFALFSKRFHCFH